MYSPLKVLFIYSGFHKYYGRPATASLQWLDFLKLNAKDKEKLNQQIAFREPELKGEGRAGSRPEVNRW